MKPQMSTSSACAIVSKTLDECIIFMSVARRALSGDLELLKKYWSGGQTDRNETLACVLFCETRRERRTEARYCKKQLIVP